MLMDTSLEFCNGLALSAASNDSTNTLDLDETTLLSVPLALVTIIAGTQTTAKATTVSVQGSANNSSFTEVMHLRFLRLTWLTVSRSICSCR